MRSFEKRGCCTAPGLVGAMTTRENEARNASSSGGVRNISSLLILSNVRGYWLAGLAGGRENVKNTALPDARDDTNVASAMTVPFAFAFAMRI